MKTALFVFSVFGGRFLILPFKGGGKLFRGGIAQCLSDGGDASAVVL